LNWQGRPILSRNNGYFSLASLLNAQHDQITCNVFIFILVLVTGFHYSVLAKTHTIATVVGEIFSNLTAVLLRIRSAGV